MAFVIDGSEWSFENQSIEQVCSILECLLDRVWVAHDRNETVWIGDELQTREIVRGYDIWGLCDPEAPLVLPAELQQELAAWLGSAPRYADEPIWPQGMSDSTVIQIADGEPTDNPDVAWAHHHVRNGRSVGCISLWHDRPRETRSSVGNANVHWIKSEAAHRTFWRDAIDVERDTEATLERLAPHAFPDLYFHPPVWRQIASFTGGYDSVRIRLRTYLAALDDHGHWVFTHPPPALRPDEVVAIEDSAARPSNQIIERRFHGIALNMAPENPDVHRDATCKAAREISIGDTTLYCEWHGKLERHQNRLHVHGPITASNDKVVIAIFADHLPLPGH